VTDSPASLGTEALEFSAKHPNVFAGRKQRPENLLSEAMESELDFTEQADDTPPDTSALFNKVKTLLGLDNKKNDQKFADQAQAIELLANQVAELGKQEVPSADNTQYTTIKAAHDQLQADFAAFKTQMEGEDKPKKFTRQAAAGGTGQALADC